MENNDNNQFNESNKTNESNFKAVTNPNTYKTVYEVEKKPKEKSHFGKTILLPFFSGVIGASLVVGTCFGVPSIKNQLMGTNETHNSSQNSQVSGLVDQVSLSNYSDTAVYAANKILPSIVGIKIEYNVTSMFSIFGGVQNSSATATGSGIIISEDGYILTNNHVVSSSESESYYQVSEATKITVSLFNDDTEYEAKIVGTDSETDLAVIKIEKTGLTKAEFADSDSIKVGEFAMAAGSPLGLQSTITCGVVSAVNRQVTDTDGKTYTLIQTDAAINAGNSGGALVNTEGKVIGVNTLKLTGDDVEGMGFAIPINSTTDITSQLIQYSKVRRPYIGITGMELDKETAEKNKLVEGIYVKDVETFSAAEKGGIKIGDVIIQADGKDVKTMDELNEIKNSHNIGDEMKLKVNRDGKELELTITLGEQP